jgi:2-methylcitrate dehydratase PrpD
MHKNRNQLSMLPTDPTGPTGQLASWLAGLTTARVELALHGAEMLSRGWHSGPVFGTFAAAAAVGVPLQLNASQFEDALGMAGTQSSGLTGARFGAMCKRMQHGLAARNGLHAAFLAAAGYAGINKVFELQHGGFLYVFGEAHSPHLSLISAGLGERWEIGQSITKTYAVMGGIHPPLDALFEIASKRKLSPDLIDHIEVDLPEAAYRHGGWRPGRPPFACSGTNERGVCALGCDSGWRRHGSAVFTHAGRKRGRVDSDSKNHCSS